MTLRDVLEINILPGEGVFADIGWEPVSGFEPLTCRLQEARSQAMGPLPAPMPHESATAALKTVRFLRPGADRRRQLCVGAPNGCKSVRSSLSAAAATWSFIVSAVV